MAEPKIEHFLSLMADPNFNPVKLSESPEDLTEVLWYIDPGRAAGGEVVNKLLVDPKTNEVQTDVRKRQIMTNLAKLYPLSRELVLSILQNVTFSDSAFFAGFDVGGKVKDNIKKIMNDVEDKRKSLTGEVSRYKKDIDQLEEKKEDILQTSEELREVRDRLNALRAEVENLERETGEEVLNQRIHEQETRRNELREKLEKQREEEKKRNDEIEHFARELEAMGNRLDSEEEMRLLRDLLRRFPDDTEDGK